MTWREVLIWEWSCDGCEAGSIENDDAAPVGWIHTIDGRDLCKSCAG